MKIWISFLVCVFMVSPSVAQKIDSSARGKIDAVSNYRKELFQSKLELNDKEILGFLAVYNEYQIELRKVKRAFRRKWYTKDLNQLNETEAKAYFQDASALAQKEQDLITKYAPEMAAVIGWSKTVRIKKIEKEIKPLLLDRANELKLEKGPKKPKKR